MAATTSANGEDGPLVRFYRGKAPDSAGRTLAEIRAWDHDRLEDVHDYVQWLFPTRTRSAFNPSAPTLDDAQVRAFRDDATLRAELLASLEVMLGFYGFALRDRDGRPVVERSAAWAERSRRWLRPGDHNLLRITRILTSLSTLGLAEHAWAFLAALEAVYAERPEAVGPRTIAFWRAAVA